MSTLVLAFIASLVVSLLLTPATRAVARRLGAVDRPDGRRKLQVQPVALGGGIAVYLAFGFALLLAGLMRPAGEAVPARLTVVLALSTGLLGVVGLLDDTLDLRPRRKLLLQFVAAAPVVLAGFFPTQITFFGHVWSAGWWVAPVALVWLVACANAVNLLDGLDGFASTAGISLAVMVAALAVACGNLAAAVAGLALAGALVGFLPYNFPPATIYLGDTGSLLIGLALGTLALVTPDASGRSVPAIVPLAIMAIPLWDVLMAIVRRRIQRLPLDAPDRNHLHHRLIVRGLSNGQALVLLAALCVATCAAASLALFWQWEAAACVVVGMLLIVLATTRAFGHHEVELTAAASAGHFARAAAWLVLPRRMRTAIVRQSFAGKSYEATWEKLVEAADRVGLETLEVSFRGGGEEESGSTWRCPGAPATRGRQTWRLSVCTEIEGVPVELVATFGQPTASAPVAVLAASTILSAFVGPIARQLVAGERTRFPLSASDTLGNQASEHRRAA